jgi:hypothetical protein
MSAEPRLIDWLLDFLTEDVLQVIQHEDLLIQGM